MTQNLLNLPRVEETKCKGCPFATVWSKYGAEGYPACSHPDSGPMATTPLSEMGMCPKE